MKRPCVLILTACLLGELLGYYLSIAVPGLIITVIAPVTVFLIKKYPKFKNQKIYIIAFLCVLSIFIFRMKYEIYTMNSKIVNIEKNFNEFCGEVKNINFKEDKVIITSKGIILYLKKEKYNDDISLGNTVKFNGSIERISPNTNPGEFNARDYYMIKGIYFRMNVKSYIVVNKHYNAVSQFFFETRQYLGNTIEKIFDRENSGVIKAVLLGVRQDLDKSIYKMYQRNGIAHLLAISGLHVSVLGIGLYKLLRKYLKLKFHTSAIISSIFLLLYGMLAGEGVSIARAGCMLVLYFIAEVAGRSYCLISALCVSAAAICFISPFELFGVSFQLSFGAVLSLGGPVAFISKKFKGGSKVFEILLVSIGVQILTLPVILYYFYTFPLYAFILNILVIPLMTFVLYSALFSVVFNIINLFLYKYVGIIAALILKLYDFLCNIVKYLPYHSIVFGRPKIIQIIIYYIYLYVIIFITINKKIKFLLLLTLPGILILFPFFKTDTAIFLDVGQGDGIYMHIDDMDILVDGGSTSNVSLGEYTMEPFLLYEGVGDIEMSLISHSDLDHISGILYLLESDIKIKNIYLPYQAISDSSYDKIKEKAKIAGSNIKYISMGDTFEYKNLKIKCLWPDKLEKENVNEQSEVLLVEIKGKRILFTGDIGKSSEESILENGNIGNVDILKVAHHGSRHSSLKKFIENVSPGYAIISYGKHNTYGHPGKETIAALKEAGCEIFETAKKGAIEVRLK